MRLDPLPTTFPDTRDALHQIAFSAIAPARYRAVGRMGLRATPGGFGTPEFDGQVAGIQGNLLVFTKAGNTATRTITTVRDAATFFGVDYEVQWYEDFHDPLEPVDPDQGLQVDPDGASALANWFAFGFVVLERLRTHVPDTTEVQLWPEHFDAATEIGDEEAGQRASYGASPGDENHAEPYVYVSAWGEIDASDPIWKDEFFNGASLSYSELVEAEDAVGRAVEFLLTGYRALTGDR